MTKRGGQIQDCITVFLSVFSGLSGVYGLYNEYTSKQIPVILWITALFTVNYWLCFYRLNKTK